MSAPHLSYLVSRYPSVSHSFILNEVSGLRRLGFKVDVISMTAPDRPAAELSCEERSEAALTKYVKGSSAGYVASSHAGALLRDPASYLSALWLALRLGKGRLAELAYHLGYFLQSAVVARRLRECRGGHIHAHFVSPVGVIAARMAGVTLSMTVHGPDEFYDVRSFRIREKIGAAKFVCAIGRFARSQLMYVCPPEFWPKFEVTPLGVNTANFTPAEFREHPSPFEILCVGRLVAAKGQLVLIEAVRRLRAEGRDLRLRLVGPGPDRRRLERVVRDRGLADCVCFEGAVNQDHIGRFYRAADAFALASFAEGIPVVLMEAMAMGVPVVSTRITGIPELIRDGIDGLLVTPSDVDELAAALRSLMEDPQLRRRLRESGRRRVLDCYDLDKNIRQLAAVFERRLAREGSSA